MTNALFGFPPSNAQASGSSFNVKRKSRAWSYDEDEDRQTQLRRLKSPPFERRSTWQTQEPELVVDHSSGTEDEQGMDVDMDGSGGGAHPMTGQQDNIEIREQGGCGMSAGYSFGHGGSGGFGFGPGAEEDDEDIDLGGSKDQYSNGNVYPSLTPHPNPNHYSSQQNAGAYGRATSPLSAQAFSPALRSPANPRGIYQPATSAPLDANANDIERARAQHGPHCKSIPKLRLSQYPDPATGKQSMWTWCPDCGSVEKAQ